MPKSPTFLEPEKLTRAAFEPFGEVIDLDDPERSSAAARQVNSGTSLRFEDLARVETAGGDASISVYRAQPRALPMELKVIERHPEGSQAFLPLEPTRFAIVVAETVDHPEPSDLRFFIAKGRQGINFKRGVWHHPLLALDQPCDFLVVDRRDQTHNLEEHDVEHWRLGIRD